MSDALPPLSEFENWLDWSDCEKLHWKHEDELVEKGGPFCALHPTREYKKNISEIFAVILLGKHLLGQRNNWDMGLSLRFNISDTLSDGKQFDAEYAFKSFQPKISGSSDRTGFMEITRALNSSQGRQERLRNQALYKQGWTQGQTTYRVSNGVPISESHKAVTDLYEGLEENKDLILERIREKAANNYPDNTILVVWFLNEENPHNLPNIVSDEPFLIEIGKANAGRFNTIYLIGVCGGCNLVFGQNV